MTAAVLNGQAKEKDAIQQHLVSYACSLRYQDIDADAVHAAKVRIIDTLGVLIAGFFAEPSRLARDVAFEMPDPRGATVIGTRLRTSVDIAAFVNSTTARFSEMTDSYHFPGSYGGHPSDVITPLLSVAEHQTANGRDFLTGVVLAYESYLRMNDQFSNLGFDHTIFCTLGVAIGAGKLLGLSADQMSHCISMAVVPNNALRVSRSGQLSMWKVIATGQAARAGVFAAQLAAAGMEGPHLPFEGKSGWCDHVALRRFALGEMGGRGAPFKVTQTNIKLRSAAGLGIPPILAAEQIAPIRDINSVKEVIVEVFKKTKDYIGTAPELWHPDSRETADHSAPYVVAVALLDGTVVPRSYNEARLKSPEVQALMQKIKVVENPEFTEAYKRREQRARVTVVTNTGQRLVGDATGHKDSPSAPKSDDQITRKFRQLTEDVLGAKRVDSILDRLWNAEDNADVRDIVRQFAFS